MRSQLNGLGIWRCGGVASVIGNGIQGTCDSALTRDVRRVAALSSGLEAACWLVGVELLVRTEMGTVWAGVAVRLPVVWRAWRESVQGLIVGRCNRAMGNGNGLGIEMNACLQNTPGDVDVNSFSIGDETIMLQKMYMFT
jgi:hypothetical protein